MDPMATAAFDSIKKESCNLGKVSYSISLCTVAPVYPIHKRQGIGAFEPFFKMKLGKF